MKKTNNCLDVEYIDTPVQLDKLDVQIIKLITKNARMPFLEVARECGVSGAAIHQRVQRLMNEKLLEGSEFIVSPVRLGYNTCAYIGLYLEKAIYDKRIIDELQTIPEVVECHSTTGTWAIFIKIHAKSNRHLKKIIDTDLQAIEGISRTETFVSLEQNFSRQTPIK